MEILECGNVHGLTGHRHRSNSFCGGGGGGERGDAGNVVADCGAADGFFVVEGFAAERRVDDEIYFGGFDEVDDVRPAFIYFEDGFDFDSRR